MEDPSMDPVPDVAFHGTFWKGDGAQIGPEPRNDTKWFMDCVLLWWIVWAPHGVIGLDCCLSYSLQFLYERGTRQVRVRGAGGCRATGMDR